MGPEEATLSGQGLGKLTRRDSKLGRGNIPDELTILGLINSEGVAWNGINRAGITIDLPAGLVALSSPLMKPAHRTRVYPRLMLTTLVDVMTALIIMDVVNLEGMTLTEGCCVGYFGHVILGAEKADDHLLITKDAISITNEFMTMGCMQGFQGNTTTGKRWSSPALTSRALTRPCA